MYKRTQTKSIKIKDVVIGHSNQVIIQSMTNTKTSNINATINSKITSIKNPISGIIKAKKIETVIIDPSKVDPKATKIISIEPVDREVSVSDQNQEGE